MEEEERKLREEQERIYKQLAEGDTTWLYFYILYKLYKLFGLHWNKQLYKTNTIVFVNQSGSECIAVTSQKGPRFNSQMFPAFLVFVWISFWCVGFFTQSKNMQMR